MQQMFESYLNQSDPRQCGRRGSTIIHACIAVLLFGGVQQTAVAQQRQPLQSSKFNVGTYAFPVLLPEGFVVELLSSELQGPRILHFFGERLFIGSKSGSVYWLDPPYTQPNELVRLPAAGQRWARPIGIPIGPDGDVYFSSEAGIQGLYRIRFQP